MFIYILSLCNESCQQCESTGGISTVQAKSSLCLVWEIYRYGQLGYLMSKDLPGLYSAVTNVSKRYGFFEDGSRSEC
jgi:hypothetical protein